MRLFILEDGRRKQVDLPTWRAWLKSGEQILRRDDLDDVRITTEFYGAEDPGTHMTMFKVRVRDANLRMRTVWLETDEQATRGHASAVSLVQRRYLADRDMDSLVRDIKREISEIGVDQPHIVEN